ncbi:MAG: hypothetical protein QM571_05480 [Micrococcaceae bacterium]
MSDFFNLAVDIINCPTNQIPAPKFVELTKDKTKNTDIKVIVYNEEELKELGCHSLLAFGAGSENETLLLKLELKGKDSTKQTHIIGEGIIFEAAGMQLRQHPINTTRNKLGKAGAAITLEALIEVAKSGKPANDITLWIPLSENVAGNQALKPLDVVTLPNGLTIEAVDVKGENHLGLFDLYVLAAQAGADDILSIASLDPMQELAVGHKYGTIVGSNADKLLTAAKTAKELVWPLPLPNYLEEKLNSMVADYKNITQDSTTAVCDNLIFAKILESVNQQPAWAHWEIGTPSLHSPAEPEKKGATGYGIKTLIEFMANSH